jgi:thiol:disulfide interchange protein DsbD
MPGRSAIHTLRLLLLVLVGAARTAALPPAPEGSHGSGALDGEEPRVEARLLVDAARVAPGASFRAGVLFTLDRGWHIYWRNSGQSGLPTELEWRAAGAKVGPVQWPAPEIFREADGFITTYGYVGQVLLTSELVLPADARGEPELAVAADFLACEVQCIPGRIELSRRIAVGVPSSADPATAELFARWGERVPVAPESLGLQLEALYSQSAIRPGDEFSLALSLVSCANGEPDCRAWRLHEPAGEAFVPDVIESVELEVTGSRAHPSVEGAALLLLRGKASPDPVGAAQRLRGVLAIQRRGAGERHVEVDLPLPRAPAGAAVQNIPSAWLEADASPATPRVSAWSALALALLGGLILNLMPCVLPVLAIKVFGIAETAQHGRAELRRSALAYTLGIESAMLALALAVETLRAAGTSVGWGFQFQEPLFIAAISAVLLVFALNLFGVFEIGVDASGLAELSRSATGARRSFFEGLLAVVLATPCSAPFLGTAVGFAFASPPALGSAIFLAVGLGLALPYLAIAAVPAWSRWLPRPGPWMAQLRRLLGFAVLATVVWLLSIPASARAVVALLAWLVAVALGTWIGGSLQAAGRRGAARATALGVAALAMAAAPLLPLHAPASSAASESPSAWRPFDPAAIQGELAAGRAVFVHFTADWCLTCKANEQLVLANPRVEGEFERLDVARFKADWTRRDERIRTELAAHGRAGVPMYLVYSPGAPDAPVVLPELLSVERVIDALRRAAPPSTQPQEEST